MAIGEWSECWWSIFTATNLAEWCPFGINAPVSLGIVEKIMIL